MNADNMYNETSLNQLDSPWDQTKHSV